MGGFKGLRNSLKLLAYYSFSNLNAMVLNFVNGVRFPNERIRNDLFTFLYEQVKISRI
ncbi:hypothetical protein MtrunA17_Chr4g0051091 [Medicago truncatula]|uniref:Uncharacterized protein n=1 Tax=Medicago truncatula TaxID=3880 RepID=A0A396IDA3_MEDTR|nr:hypothetical protein MtrunA17_Chr4g0051091 [Medicago truncatula]